jgi:hypothetical protein
MENKNLLQVASVGLLIGINKKLFINCDPLELHSYKHPEDCLRQAAPTKYTQLSLHIYNITPNIPTCFGPQGAIIRETKD